MLQTFNGKDSHEHKKFPFILLLMTARNNKQSGEIVEKLCGFLKWQNKK